jgi:hypothetical protein
LDAALGFDVAAGPDTVLGLSVTPAAFGWVLAEGHGADGTILEHRELALRAGSAASTAEQVAAEVLRMDAQAAVSGHHPRVIGVTWSDDASAHAALVLESLMDAGFDNVVPVRLHDAVENLAGAIAPVIGHERTAICILERDWATVAQVDIALGDVATTVQRVPGGCDELSSWLGGMFEPGGWRPGGVVVVGADSEIDGFSRHLEKALPVAVFAQTMAQVTVARGAALAAARNSEFTDEHLLSSRREPAPTPSRHWSYAGAATALAVGAITFVGALSVAVGIHLLPGSDRTTPRHAAPASAPHIAEAVTPPGAPADPQPGESAPAARNLRSPEGETIPQGSNPPNVPDPQTGAVGRQPYLTRVLDQIPGDADNAAAPSEGTQP